jgi:uncharacterized protein
MINVLLILTKNMEKMTENTITSPCIQLCAIDEKTSYCFGCGRTREEIKIWRTSTPIERQEIMALLPKRLQSIKRKTKRMTRRKLLERQKTT